MQASTELVNTLNTHLEQLRAAGAEDVQVMEVAGPGLLSGTQGVPGMPLHQAAALRSGGGAKAADSAAILPEDVTGSATVHARFRVIGSRPA